MVKNQDTIFDSTKNENVGGPKKPSLTRLYFPIIITIILAEAVLLGFVIFDMVPVHDFQIYPYAQYGQYVSPGDLTNIAVTVTKWFFFLLTAGVLVPTTLIIIMEVGRRFIVNRRGKEHGWDDDFPILEKLDKEPKLQAGDKQRVKGDYIMRFDVHQRIQHYALMGSFIVLAVTGLLRGFPDWPTFAWFTSIFGGTEVLRLVHDIAAFVMIADGIYHLGYIAYGYFFMYRSPSAMFPKWKDLKDIVHTILWIFGMYKKEPEYDHFQYGQKIDYWAIFWGMPVMVITGIMMMFPSVFAPLIGGNWMAVMATAHRDEAILATGFILIVHMYYGHLQTTAFPVNTVMFTGKMLKSKYKEWFSREYRQLTGEKEKEK